MMCQLDRILIEMSINLFIKHDSACLYFPFPFASFSELQFLSSFLYGRKNNSDESFHSLPYEPLSSDPLMGNCSWKVWTVPLFSLTFPTFKRKTTASEDIFVLPYAVWWFFYFMTFACLFPLSSRVFSQFVEICHVSVVQQSGRQQI